MLDLLASSHRDRKRRHTTDLDKTCKWVHT